MERSGEEGGGEGGQKRRRRQKGKKLKGGPGIESTCWVVVVVGRIHGDRKPRLDPKEDVFRFEKKKKTREEDRFDHRAKRRGGRVLSFPPPLKGKGWRNHLLGRGRVAFAYFSQFLSVSDHPVTRISLFLRLSSSKFFIETKNIFLFDKKKEGGEKVEKWTVLQVSPSFPSLPSREPRRKNGGQVIGVNHGIGIGIICFCFFPPPPPPLFVRPIRSFVCLFIYFFFEE